MHNAARSRDFRYSRHTARVHPKGYLQYMSEASDPRLYHPHVARNREPIRDVLRRVLPYHGLVLEVASGSGEHAAYFAQELPFLTWQPTDPDAAALASIAAHRAAADVPNLLPPLRLDVTAEEWPLARADAVMCNNMIHISPWAATQGLIAGAGRTLPAGGVLYLYGPYKIDGRHTAPSNQEFDASLRARNAEWGIRDLADIVHLAERHDLALAETVAMPANNLSVVFRRRP
jgi:SAM-dependent methyltransferase